MVTAKILKEPNKEHIKNNIYYVPEDITEIGESAFLKADDFWDIEGIVLPEGLKKIGDNAFFDCFLYIKKLIIPSTVEEIGNGAIWGWDSLESVFILAKIKKMGAQAFCNCSKATIFFPFKDFILDTWDKDWFGNCKQIDFMKGYIPNNYILYYLAERFFPTKEYDAFSAVKGRKELVSFDCSLMSEMIQCDSLDESLKNIANKNTQQILAVNKNPSVGFEKIIGGDFEFCGFDLCEEQTVISAITNCGEGFETAIDYTGLNEYGLIKEHQAALIAQSKLEERFPDEPHACCEIYAIWRKVIE